MIYAIVISFNPRILNLNLQFKNLQQQVHKIILIDNGSRNQTELQSLNTHEKLHIILLTKNLGIAEAQNIGIKIAEEEGAGYVIFFDQDSLPELNLVSKLLEISLNHEILDDRPNIIGPVSQDMRTGRKSFFLVKSLLGFKNQFCTDENRGIIQCNFLISSGTLIPIKVFKKIGTFRSDFFIDLVDTEFCIRATNAGINIYGVCETILYHNLGDSIKKIWFGRWREISIHSHIRNYYMSRNSIFMIFYIPMEILWKIRILKRVFYYFFFSIFFSPPRFTRLFYFIKGMKDGLFKNMGKLNDS